MQSSTTPSPCCPAPRTRVTTRRGPLNARDRLELVQQAADTASNRILLDVFIEKFPDVFRVYANGIFGTILRMKLSTPALLRGLHEIQQAIEDTSSTTFDYADIHSVRALIIKWMTGKRSPIGITNEPMIDPQVMKTWNQIVDRMIQLIHDRGIFMILVYTHGVLHVVKTRRREIFRDV